MRTFRQRLNSQVEISKRNRSLSIVAIVIALLALLVSLASCNAYQNNLIERHNWSERKVELIRQGTIEVGFTKDQVKAAWGWPVDINKTISSNYYSEQWVYGTVYKRQYVYFDSSGKVTSIQDY